MVLVSLCTIGLFVLSLCKLFDKFLLIDTTIFNSLGGLQTFPIVHAVSNAYHMWRFEPIAGLIAHYVGADWAIWWLVFNFSVGTAALIFILLPKDSQRATQAILLGSLSAMSLLVLFGLDSVIWGSLSWLPLLFAILLLGFERGFELKTILAFLFVSILQALSANQVALLFAIPMALFGWDRARYLNPKVKYQLIFSLLIPAILVSFLMPPPFFERYTLLSHFVPYYLTEEGRFGLIGPELDPSPIDLTGLRSTLRLNFLYGGLAIFIIFLLKGFLGFRQNNGKFDLTKSLWAAFFIFLALIWTTLEESDLAQISPISAINRLLPGLYLIPLDSIVFAFAVVSLLILVALGLTSKNRAFYNLTLSAGTFYFVAFSPVIWSESANKFQKLIPVETNLDKSTAPISLTHQEFRDAFHSLPSFKKVGIVSPGLHILLNHGLSVIDDFNRQKEIKSVDLATLSPKLFSFPTPPDLNNILDAEKNTRSRIGKAPIKGNEWLLIELGKPMPLQGIWIRSEEFHWDYARSVQILVSSECDGEGITKSGNFDTFKEVYEDSSWEGYVNLSPQGVPFYGPASEMKVFFTPQSSVGCILIRNRTADSGYDWSITQILVIPR